MTAPRPQGSVEKAVRSELRALSVSVQQDGSAALAVSLARQIDTARGAVAAAAAAGQLRALLIDLRKLAAEQPERDVIDDLNARRTRRAAAG
jgi:hypothetical protein